MDAKLNFLMFCWKEAHECVAHRIGLFTDVNLICDQCGVFAIPSNRRQFFVIPNKSSTFKTMHRQIKDNRHVQCAS